MFSSAPFFQKFFTRFSSVNFSLSLYTSSSNVVAATEQRSCRVKQSKLRLLSLDLSLYLLCPSLLCPCLHCTSGRSLCLCLFFIRFTRFSQLLSLHHRQTIKTLSSNIGYVTVCLSVSSLSVSSVSVFLLCPCVCVLLCVVYFLPSLDCKTR